MADVKLANDAKCNYSAIIAAMRFFVFKFTSTSEANVDLPDVYLTCTKRLSLARTHTRKHLYFPVAEQQHSHHFFFYSTM